MFEGINDIVLSTVVFLIGGMSAVLLGRWLKLSVGLVAFLVLWHAMFALYYAYFILHSGGDAFGYYQRARFDYIDLDFGTAFVVWLTSFPASLGFSFGAVSLVYNAIGTIGLVFFYGTVRETGVFEQDSRMLRLMALLCLLIPSMSFWSGGIGKDAIAYLAVCVFLWATMDIGRRQPAAVVAVLAMLGVRPHIAALMVLSVAAGTVLLAEVRGTIRFSAAAIAAAGAVFAVPLALSYTKSTQFSSLAEYIADRQELNMGGGSSIDITGMNPVMRLLSFLYRPLPNEASGFDQLASSIDNLFLIALTLLGLIGMYRAGFVRVFRRHSIALLYGLASLVLLSQVTANLGLATRQKWMFVPALILAALSAWTMVKDGRPKMHLYPRYLRSSQAAR